MTTAEKILASEDEHKSNSHSRDLRRKVNNLSKAVRDKNTMLNFTGSTKIG